MAISRNKRRLLSKLRSARSACDLANSMAVEARRAQVRDNLSRPAKRDNSHGLVMDYSPARNPVSYTRPLRYSRGPANVGTSGGLPIAK